MIKLSNTKYSLQNINNSILLPNDTDTNHGPIVKPSLSLSGNGKEADTSFVGFSGVNTSLDNKEITFQSIQQCYSLEITEETRLNLGKIEKRFLNCNQFIAIARCHYCGDELKRVNLKCNLPFCPDCNKKVYGRFFYRVAYLLEKHYRNLKFVTLTANLKPTKENVDFLRAKFHKLRKIFHWKNTIYCFECGSRGNKLHIHAIICGLFVKQSKISRVWQSLTDFPIVYIEKVSNPKKAISYIASYISKHTPLFLAEVYGKRKLSTTGIFYRIKCVIEITLPEIRCESCKCSWVYWEFYKLDDFCSGYP